jgi:hypothetical protein
MGTSWMRRLLVPLAGNLKATKPRPTFRPYLEKLEDRAVPAGLVVTANLTPQQLVANLLGAGVTVTNVTYKGTPTSSGTFTGGTGILGFESGVVLSTGLAASVVGPNDNLDSASTDIGLPGYPELDTLQPQPPSASHDATVLSFDFVPTTNTLTFNFVFGSEEYGQFVGAGFNDVFGFFLNGQNVAVLPGTNTPVGVATVNDGNPANNTPPANPQFFINNSPPNSPVPAPNAVNTQLDGITTVIPVTAVVNPGVTNHIDLGIEDVIDGILDSDVFIQAGSFTAMPPPTPVVPPPVLPAAAPVLAAYRPFRYAFRSLEQNEGLSGPLPTAGAAATPSYDGNITVLNFGPGSSTNSLLIEFASLPQGVQVLNATGVDPNTNLPFILVPATTIPGGGTEALRVPVKLSNPDSLPLGTFFEGPYFVDVLAGSTIGA